jgi:hypothetical protein
MVYTGTGDIQDIICIKEGRIDCCVEQQVPGYWSSCYSKEGFA